VRWDVICRPKKEGGLGVRDLRLVNISLLAKWKWKLLSHESEVWKDVVVARYGADVVGKKCLSEIDVTRMGSSWWRDICLIDKDSTWFSRAIGKKVGNGNSTSFWNEHWIGEQSLRQRFPRLFGISSQRDEVIQNMGWMNDGRWQWELQWRRNLFAWEEDQFRDFLEIIAPFTPSIHHDCWLWMGDEIRGFTANSAYLLLVAEYNQHILPTPTLQFVFKNLWKCGAPFKISAFSWQLILDRIQTKDNLVKRHIIGEQQGMCVLCGVAPESATHLFLHCRVAVKVWYDIIRWLGFIFVLPHSIESSLAVLLGCGKNKKQRVGLCLIWNAFMWVLWSIRNGVIFNNDAVLVDEVSDRIKRLSWKWYVERIAKWPFLSYEWEWNPVDCMVH
jgi:hypothetical protein